MPRKRVRRHEPPPLLPLPPPSLAGLAAAAPALAAQREHYSAMLQARWAGRIKERYVRPEEEDLRRLLLTFLLRVRSGAPLSFATFKRAWQDLHCSYLLSVRCWNTMLLPLVFLNITTPCAAACLLPAKSSLG